MGCWWTGCSAGRAVSLLANRGLEALTIGGRFRALPDGGPVLRGELVHHHAAVLAIGDLRDHLPESIAHPATQLRTSTRRSQSATSSAWRGRRYPPDTFTEQGAAMLASVLRSKRAADARRPQRPGAQGRGAREAARRPIQGHLRRPAGAEEPPVEKTRRVGFQREAGSGGTTKGAKGTKAQGRRSKVEGRRSKVEGRRKIVTG
jgi:hypothetical protein